MPGKLEFVSEKIDLMNYKIGNFVSWLSFLMVVTTFVIVVMRYVFSEGSILVQEMIMYMFGAVFMFGGAYTYLKGGHVRVDIFFKNRSAKQQALINVFGNLFLLIPMMVAIFYISMPYVIFSWSLLEGSKDAGGLDLVYILKTTIPIFALLMTLQSVSEIIKNYHVFKREA